MSAPRGMTLIEAMIAGGLMLFALAAAGSLVVSGGRLASNAEMISDSNDDARLAGEAVSGALRLAGLGAVRGVYVNRNGAPALVNPLFGMDGTTGAGANPPGPSATGADDLWLILPSPNAFRDSCGGPSTAPGAAAAVAAPSPGGAPLSVTCAQSFAIGDRLLVTNLGSAALISLTGKTDGTATAPATLTYDESRLTGFSDAPEKGGFQLGDAVFGARLVHFYVANNALFRADGAIAWDEIRDWPFSDLPGSQRKVASNIEDLQIAYGTDPGPAAADPTRYNFQHGLAPAFQPGLRAIRVSVVALSRTELKDTDNHALNTFGPLTVENHTPDPGARPGFRRALYSRRIELPNMAAGNL